MLGLLGGVELVVHRSQAADVEWEGVAACLPQDNFSPTVGRVPNSELVHDVLISGRDIDNDEFTTENQVDHLAMDEARLAHLVGSDALNLQRLDRWLDKLLIYGIKIYIAPGDGVLLIAERLCQ